MKRLSGILIGVLLFCMLPIQALASTEIEIDYGIKFELSDEWSKKEFNTETEFLKYKYESDEHGILMIGVIDAYGQLSESEKKGYSRAEIDNSYLTEDDVREMFQDGYEINSISQETYGEYSFYVVDVTYSYTVDNIVMGEVVPNTYKAPAEMDIIVYNGYMIMFQHFNYSSGPMIDIDGNYHETSPSYTDHISILSSLDLSSIEPDYSVDGGLDIAWGYILVGIALLGVVFLIIPIIIKVATTPNKQ